MEHVELPPWAQAGPQRVAHISRVATLVREWAAALGVSDAEATRWSRAAVLHDALRDAGPAELARFTPQGDWPVALWHGPAAAAAARADGETDEGVLAAVSYHSVGWAAWDAPGRMLYLADYLEPGRTHDRPLLDSLAARVTREAAAVLRETAALRLQRAVGTNRQVRRESWEFWNSLALPEPR